MPGLRFNMVDWEQPHKQPRHSAVLHLYVHLRAYIFILICLFQFTNITWDRHYEVALKLRVKTVKIRLINLPYR